MYGNWCGGGCAGLNGEPIDDLDEHCKVHDFCYETTDTCERCKCDAELIAQADKVSRGLSGGQHLGKAGKQRAQQALSSSGLRNGQRSRSREMCAHTPCDPGSNHLPCRSSKRAAAAASTSFAGRTSG